MRSAKTAAIAALLIVFPAFGVRAAEIVLTNGSTLDAPILKETGEHLFVDLGFTVLPIPKDRIKRVSGGSEPGEAAPNVARFFGPSRQPAAGAEKADRIYRLISPIRRNGLKDIKASELVERYNESVVVVSAGGGWGTGFFIDKRGYIITNHHVIAGSDKINVTLLVKGDGGKRSKEEFKKVTIVADNSWLDLALLKIDEEKLKKFAIKPVTLERTDNIRKGDTVFAIGNPGMGSMKLSHTVSEGIVSSRARNLNNLPYVQTTAAVNPGNSGGPLFNAKGLVVGVVTLKAFWQEGIAFALPSNYVVDFIRNREAFAYKKSEIEYLDPPKKQTPEDKPKPKKDAKSPPTAAPAEE